MEVKYPSIVELKACRPIIKLPAVIPLVVVTLLVVLIVPLFPSILSVTSLFVGSRTTFADT